MPKKKSLIYIVFFLLIIQWSFADKNPPGLEALIEAYPKSLKAEGGNMIVWPDGSKMPYTAEKKNDKRSFDEILNNASIADQMSQAYPLGPDSYAPPAKNQDPGRIRNEGFFLKMYGKSEAEVRENLRTIVWLPNKAPQKLRVTTINGVDKKLEAVSAELEKLPDNQWKFATPSAGTFNWRKIAGTQRMSTHSFGTSIDLDVKKSNYWKWDRTLNYRNKFPTDIIELFEKHGFIWGGKWYHYDTMHFEYRPELLIQAKMKKPKKEEAK